MLVVNAALNMSLSSRLWSIVTKVAVRSMGTSRERLLGFFWLSPFCLWLVTILRTVVAVCSVLKPCWCSFSNNHSGHLEIVFLLVLQWGSGVQLF